MLKALIKTRLAAFFSYLLGRGSRRFGKNKPIYKILFGLLFIYIGIVFLSLFAMFFSELVQPFNEAGIDWFYFSITAFLAFAFCFVGSIFMTKAQIYEAKDNELLLAMPILPSYILASRLIFLFILNCIYAALVYIPAGVVYFMKSGIDIAGIGMLILSFLMVTLLALTVSLLIGWFIAFINTKIRNSNVVTVILYIAFLAAYMYLYSNMQKYIVRLIANGEVLANAVKRAFYPLYSFGAIVTDKSLIQFFIVVLVSLLPFVLAYILLSRSFLNIATSKKAAPKAVYHEKTLKVSGITVALIKKELKRFVSSPIYMLNASLGVVFTIIFAAMLLINNKLLFSLLTTIPFPVGDFVAPVLCVLICALSSTNIISAPSISLEGKNLWIIKSLPVSAGKVLLAKAYTQMIICLPPSILASIAGLNALMLTPSMEPTSINSLSPLMVTLIIITPVTMNIFMALFGVAVNLKFPRFDWMSEAVAVKQSMSTLIVMMSGMTVVAVPTILYTVFAVKYLSAELYILIATVLLAVISLILFKYLSSGAEGTFSQLGN